MAKLLLVNGETVFASQPAAWKKDGFEFLYFAAKTVGCAAKW
jgi:hypothetical protein